MRSFTHVLLVFALCGLCVSCGGSGSGSGGGAPLGPAAFAGTYETAAFRALQTGMARDTSTLFGTFVADGVGDCTLALTQNDDTVVSALPIVPATFTVDAQGRIQIGQLSGLVGSGGETALLTSEGSGDPLVMALARAPASPQANDSLVGLYRLNMFSNGGSMFGHSLWMVFDGLGVVSFGLGLVNDEGTVDPNAFSVYRSYAVSTEGHVHINFSTSLTLQGVVLEGGELVIVAGSSTDGQRPAFGALVRAEPGDESRFSGSYAFASLEFDPVDGMVSIGGIAEADGVGALTRTGTTNTNGAAAPSAPWAGTFTVDPEGTLEIVDPGGDTFQGAVSPSGRFAVVGGGVSAGSNPGIQLYFRR